MIPGNERVSGPAPDGLRRARRIAWYGGAVVVVIGYAALIPAKWYGLLPSRMTWSRVLLGPVLMALMSPLIFFLPRRPLKRTLLWAFAVVACLLTLALVLDFIDPPPITTTN